MSTEPTKNDVYLRRYASRIFNKFGEKVTKLEKEIEERKRTEETLKRSEKMTHIGSWAWYPKTNKIIWSDEMFHIFGISKEKFQEFQSDLEKIIDKIILHEDREIVRDANKKIIEKQQFFPIEYRIIWSDGSTHTIYSEPLEKTVDNSGNIINLSGIAQDITERKHIENALKESTEKYKSLFENAKDAVFILDIKTGIIIDANTQAEKLLKKTKDQIIGKHHTTLHAKECTEKANRGLKEHIDTKGEYPIYANIVTSDNEKIPVEINASTITFPDGKQIIQGIFRDITERKLAEEKLRKSEENLKYAQRVSHIGNWGWDLKKDKITWSEETFRIHGLDPTKPEPSYEQLLKLYHQEDTPKFAEVVSKCKSDGKSYNIVCRITLPDGSLHYLEGRGEAVRDNKGNIIKLFGTSSDITERKLVENNLRVSTAIFENLSEGIYLIGLDDLIIKWANPVLEKMFGYDNGEIIGKRADIVSVSTDKTVSETRTSIFDTLKRTGEWSGEIENIKKDGTHFWCYVNASVFDHPQFGMAIVSVNTDITEYKKSKERLQLFRNLMDRSNDAVFINNPDTGLIIDVNDKVCTSLGYSREELLNMCVFDVEVSISKKLSWEDHVRDVKNKKHVILEGIDKRKDGTTFPVEVNVSFIDLGKASYMFAIVRDITERKMSEDKINKINEDLKRSNKELDQFAYIASHDLQEPLRTIYSFTDLLEENYKGRLGPEADEFMDFITSATRRMQQMINDLLALSRVGTRGKPFIWTNTKNVISTVCLDLSTLIKETEAIITHDDMPIIMADENQIAQLFQNLIDNAIKFRKKGTIPRIHISAKREYDKWIFSVQDNGIGIEEKQFKKLFIIFSRLHNREEYPGTGIGLAMCKKIIERHGGNIWLESKVGEGSKFYFTIPLRHKNYGQKIE